jgi:hypothetical protein
VLFQHGEGRIRTTEKVLNSEKALHLIQVAALTIQFQDVSFFTEEGKIAYLKYAISKAPALITPLLLKAGAFLRNRQYYQTRERLVRLNQVIIALFPMGPC